MAINGTGLVTLREIYSDMKGIFHLQVLLAAGDRERAFSRMMVEIGHCWVEFGTSGFSSGVVELCSSQSRESETITRRTLSPFPGEATLKKNCLFQIDYQQLSSGFSSGQSCRKYLLTRIH